MKRCTHILVTILTIFYSPEERENICGDASLRQVVKKNMNHK